MIISGFPGIGKTYYTNKYPKKCSDSDCSLFLWINSGKRRKINPLFPDNYMRHLIDLENEREVIFVSTQERIRKELTKRGKFYYLVYPDPCLKKEYLERYETRGSSDSFITLMNINWNSLIRSCKGQDGCEHIILSRGVGICDVMNHILGELK